MGPLAYLHTETCFTQTILTNLVSALFFLPNSVCIPPSNMNHTNKQKIVQLLFPSLSRQFSDLTNHLLV